jgi:hypothetical protein
MLDVSKNGQFEDAERRLELCDPNDCGGMENTNTSPDLTRTYGITSKQTRCPWFRSGWRGCRVQRTAGRRGRCNATVKYDKRRGADEEDEEEILS